MASPLTATWLPPLISFRRPPGLENRNHVGGSAFRVARAERIFTHQQTLILEQSETRSTTTAAVGTQ